ncbi:hypothetical protein NIES4102_07420 [Chondrocystis sp. NIES-4102]|nr:hypothetical protein NIES4102_07420 [Chondrocystis sp. NIES-4102]
MATKESNSKINHIKITLPLIALCLPLFVKHYAEAENSCPYETYLHFDGKCLDISAEGLNNINQGFSINSSKVVNREIADLHQRVEKISNKIEQLCMTEIPQTSVEIDIVENVCQY